MSPTPERPEPGREHLRRALAALPVHQPDAAVWPRVLAQLATEQAVARVLPALPTHEPAPALWARIAGQLGHGTPRPAPLPQLPRHEPDDALWDAIAARLDSQPAPAERPARPAHRRPAAPRPWWLRAAGTARRRAVLAATTLLLAGLAWWLPRPGPGAPETATAPRETISYGEEVVADAPRPAGPAGPAASPALPDALGVQGVAFIDAHCSSLPTVCQSAQFRELRSQLDELETEEARLADDLRRFGSRPELLRHQSRITTQKAAATRELIHLLIS